MTRHDTSKVSNTLASTLTFVIAVGDLVRLVAGGVSTFEVLELEDDQHALVIAADVDAPGRYPFSTQTKFLVPATDEA